MADGSSLSKREREIAALVAEGLTDRAIAQRLFISGRTAESHVRHILDKLGFDNRAQIASWTARTELGRDREQTPEETATTPGDLPVQVTSFVGRGSELARLRRLLSEVRLLTLCGPGGSGKTRLAIEAVAGVASRYPDGAWFIDLGSTADPNVVPRSIASRLGVRERDGADPLQAIAAELAASRRPRHSLIMLDNCEHLIEACAAAVAALLRASPRLAFLCTSREPLHIAGEAVWRVDPLPLPETEASVAEAMGSSDALRLFWERARLSDPRFELGETVLPYVVHLMRQLDGIPLALELAAARVGLMPLAQMVRHLEQRVGGVRARDAIARHQTLTATLDWSYELLDEGEQALLRRLGVFAGGFTEEAVEAVCGDAPESAPGTLERLAALVDKSMVQPVPPRVERYRLLEIIRRYALALLAGDGELERFRRRHLDHYLAFAERAAEALTGPDQSSWLDRMAADHDNLRAALETSRSDDIERRLRLVLALSRFWTVRGHLGEGRQWLDDVLGAAETGPATVLRAEAHNAAGGLAFEQGDLASARRHLEASLALWSELGDPLRVQPCLGNLGLIASVQEDWETALTWYGESLSLARELDNERAIALMLGNRAVVRSHLGDHEAAGAQLEEALVLTRTLGDELRVAEALANLGTHEIRRGRPAEAAAAYAESLRILRSLGARHNVAECLEGSAWLAARAGRAERALRLAAAADGLRETLRAPAHPTSRKLVADWLPGARAELGEAAERSWREGLTTPVDEAIAMALEESAGLW